MDRDLLMGYLEAGLSLIEIGDLENRDPSTVGYWVKKHGLVANGQAKYAPRGGLTREQLEPLVEAGATLEEMARALDRSERTVSYWLRKFGLQLGRRGPRPRVSRDLVDAALAQGKRTLMADCPVHGPSTFVIESSTRVRCRECRKHRVADWRRRTRRILVAEAGGECRLCGYKKCIAALEFHHLDPAQKSFGLSFRGLTRSIARLREEAKKCILLCSNCHVEVEHGTTILPVELGRADRPRGGSG